MRKLLSRPPSRRLVLDAETALDLMAPDAPTLAAAMTMRDAARILSERGLGAAPVLDEAGRPVGVLSRADIVRHGAQKEEDGSAPTAEGKAARERREKRPAARVGDIMTPVLLSLRPKTPASAVVDALLTLDVHQLFVTDEAGGIIGIVSARDILRHLQFEPPADGDFSP